MKKTLLTLVAFISLLSSTRITAQTFTITSDTITRTVLKVLSPADNITNITGSNLTLNWHVVASDFPSDWLTLTAFGICDNFTCGFNGGGSIWNESTNVGGMFTSTYYTNSTHDSTGAFGLALDLSSATTLGTHYMTINVRDVSSAYSKNMTFVISKTVSTVGVASVSNAPGEILLYPNPAVNEVNLVYDGNNDVKNIAVYNIIGKMESVYKVNGTSANLNLEHIASGIYFVKLYDGAGRAVGTRKFTKQ